jgi:outer membrane murein-binding lipoprotein Lpp
MSEYGRLWEQASGIRNDLKRLVPGIDASTLGAACASFETRSEALREELEEKLAQAKMKLTEWAQLEQKMERTE